MPVKFDRFGYFYPRNTSDWWDGVFNMYTGQQDLSTLGQIHSWNYSAQSPHFPGECGRVRGAGDFFAPGTAGQDKIELYSNDLCRPLTLEYTNE